MKFNYLLLLVMALYVSCADYDLLKTTNPDPVKLSIVKVDGATVTLSWTPGTDENFLNYKIYFDTTDGVHQLADSISFASVTTKTIRNLKPATYYYFCVILTNQAGKSSPSNIIETVTQLSFLPQQSIGDSSIMLKWTPIKNGPVSGYRIFSDTTGNVDTTDVEETNQTDSSLVVTNLKAGTVKNFKIFARDNNGYISSSPVTSLTGQYFRLYAPEKTSDTTSVQLHWNRVAKATRYIIFSDSTSTVDSSDTVSDTVEAADTSVVINKLIPVRKYYFRVYAQESTDFFAWSNSSGLFTVP